MKKKKIFAFAILLGLSLSLSSTFKSNAAEDVQVYNNEGIMTASVTPSYCYHQTKDASALSWYNSTYNYVNPLKFYSTVEELSGYDPARNIVLNADTTVLTGDTTFTPNSNYTVLLVDETMSEATFNTLYQKYGGILGGAAGIYKTSSTSAQAYAMTCQTGKTYFVWCVNNSMSSDAISYEQCGKKPIIVLNNVYADIDMRAPSVTGTNSFTVSVDSMPSQNEILSHVTVTDDVDSNPKLVVSSSTYNPSSKVIGTYYIEVYGEDATGNHSETYTLTIKVEDVTKPVISIGTVIADNDRCLTQDELKALFSATDNYYPTDQLTKQIISDGYTSNYAKSGSYNVTCRVTDPSGNYADKTQTIIVRDVIPPKITASDVTKPNTTLLSNDELKALFSLDKGSIISIETNYNSTNYHIPGNYYVKAVAQSSTGNYTSEKTITLTIVDKTAPTVTTSTTVVNNDKCLTQDEITALFNATDDCSTALKKEIISDGYTSNYARAGSYNVICRVTDEAGNYTDTTLAIIVKDVIPPTITGTNHRQPNNVKLTQEELLALFNVSEDAASVEITSDNYSPNYHTAINWEVTATATDAFGNAASYTIIIEVYDAIPPTIVGTTTSQVYNKCLTQEELLALFRASDDSQRFTVEIITNNYTNEYNKLGSYNIIARVTDRGNNSAEATSTINVIDNIAPVITGSDINVTNATVLSDEEIIEKFKIIDEYYGELEVSISWIDDYHSYAKRPGSYKFSIFGTDGSSNQAISQFNMLVTDGTAPDVWLDNHFIVIDEKTEITQELLITYANYSLTRSDVIAVTGEYENTEGTYMLTALLADDTQAPITLSVIGKNLADDPSTPDDPSNEQTPGEQNSNPVSDFDFNKFFSTENYSFKGLFDFANWKQWNFYTWLTWVAPAFIIIAIIIFKKFKK